MGRLCLVGGTVLTNNPKNSLGRVSGTVRSGRREEYGRGQGTGG